MRFLTIIVIWLFSIGGFTWILFDLSGLTLEELQITYESNLETTTFLAFMYALIVNCNFLINYYVISYLSIIFGYFYQIFSTVFMVFSTIVLSCIKWVWVIFNYIGYLVGLLLKFGNFNYEVLQISSLNLQIYNYLSLNLLILIFSFLIHVIFSIWARAAGPRVRIDQMSKLTWKDYIFLAVGIIFIAMFCCFF